MQEYFSEIEVPRHKGYMKHKLADVDVMRAIMCRTLRDNGFCRKQSRIFGKKFRNNKHSINAGFSVWVGEEKFLAVVREHWKI